MSRHEKSPPPARRACHDRLGSGKSLVFLTEKAPAIRGIGIVCSGGGIQGPAEITSLLSSVFGTGATASLSRQRDSGAERKIGAYSAPRCAYSAV